MYSFMLKNKFLLVPGNIKSEVTILYVIKLYQSIAACDVCQQSGSSGC